MKLRQHKHLRFIQSNQHMLAMASWNRYIEKLLELTPEEKTAQDERHAKFWDEIQQIMSEATPRWIHDSAEISPVSKDITNMVLGELVEPVIEEPTGIAYLNEKDQLVAVPLESDAGRHAVEMFKDFIAPTAPSKFIVAKKTTGEIVGEFDLLEDAEAVISKAKRAKKQALVLL